jgi:hypothetical protein
MDGFVERWVAKKRD